MATTLAQVRMTPRQLVNAITEDDHGMGISVIALSS